MSATVKRARRGAVLGEGRGVVVLDAAMRVAEG